MTVNCPNCSKPMIALFISYTCLHCEDAPKDSPAVVKYLENFRQRQKGYALMLKADMKQESHVFTSWVYREYHNAVAAQKREHVVVEVALTDRVSWKVDANRLMASSSVGIVFTIVYPLEHLKNLVDRGRVSADAVRDDLAHAVRII